jgi:hypothetical protein
VKAYAINSQGTAYGNQETFTTAIALSLATITTTAASSITSTGVILGGNVTADGNAVITERGVVYATTQTPTTSNTKIPVGTGTGSFNTTVTGLTAATTYYVRAYAINSQGTAYGSQESFKTGIAFNLPTVSTALATNITSSGAIFGGNVSADGNAAVSERGFIYSTTQTIATTDTKIGVGTGTGSFTINVTSLTAGTTYYVRAYAINSQGTAYGSQVAFQTTSTIQSQTGADYYLPLRVGNYLKFEGSDRTTYHKIVGTETINGEIYFIEERSDLMHNSSGLPVPYGYFWLRKDNTGNIVLGASSSDGKLSSKVVADSPGHFFPNQYLTQGYSYSSDYGVGQNYTALVISVTATAGIYKNCIQVLETFKTNGITTKTEESFYAYHIGCVQINNQPIFDFVNIP